MTETTDNQKVIVEAVNRSLADGCGEEAVIVHSTQEPDKLGLLDDILEDITKIISRSDFEEYSETGLLCPVVEKKFVGRNIRAFYMDSEFLKEYEALAGSFPRFVENTEAKSRSQFLPPLSGKWMCGTKKLMFATHDDIKQMRRAAGNKLLDRLDIKIPQKILQGMIDNQGELSIESLKQIEVWTDIGELCVDSQHEDLLWSFMVRRAAVTRLMPKALEVLPIIYEGKVQPFFENCSYEKYEAAARRVNKIWSDQVEMIRSSGVSVLAKKDEDKILEPSEREGELEDSEIPLSESKSVTFDLVDGGLDECVIEAINTMPGESFSSEEYVA
ncbi:MAG: hypothetical protein HQL54_05875 [Magnetococcales bacterium]|nr:hypothetical protein [Magnetococcales bacterium]